MKLTLFIVLAALYVAACAATDGLFNRLIFREHRRLPHDSTEKRLVYLRGEWSWISLVFLLYLGLVAPSLASWAIGGTRYVLVFWVVFLLVHWNVIVGRLVFDRWFGDTPGMKLGALGWIRTSAWVSVIGRLILAVIVAIVAARTG
jgi:hypothetical protein